jgi:alpha-L-fucosidase 2
MKKIKLFLLFAAFSFFAKAGEINRSVLWYDAPAKNWNEALPIGNGNLGAMVFGYAEQERIALNEETLWTGGPAEQNSNPDAPRYLSKVRQLLFEGKNEEAFRVMRKMQGSNTQMYQPLGDLFIFQQSQSKATDYYRDLDLATATTTTRFKQDGVTFTREMFASAPDSVLVFRLTANQKGALNIRLAVHHELSYETVLEGNDLVLKAKARIGSDEDGNLKPVVYEDTIGDKGMFFQFRVRVISCDGEVVPADSMLSINNATEAVILLSGATSFNGFRDSSLSAGKDPQAVTLRILRSLRGKSFDAIKADHLAEYQTSFNRVDLMLSDAPIPQIPTDQRLADYKKGIADLHLEELYFQFGRYLHISCSRPGGVAANLKGLWCESMDPYDYYCFTLDEEFQREKAHPIMKGATDQIDGNLDSIADISEFLLQSQLGELQLLPALPEAWKDGAVKGLKACGTFDVDIIWKNSKLLRADITSRKSAPCVVRVNQSIKIVGAKVKKQKVKIQDKVQYIYRFPSECGKTYHILGL